MAEHEREDLFGVSGDDFGVGAAFGDEGVSHHDEAGDEGPAEDAEQDALEGEQAGFAFGAGGEEALVGVAADAAHAFEDAADEPHGDAEREEVEDRGPRWALCEQRGAGVAGDGGEVEGAEEGGQLDGGGDVIGVDGDEDRGEGEQDHLDDIGEDDAVEAGHEGVGEADGDHDGGAGDLAEGQEVGEELAGALGEVGDHADAEQDVGDGAEEVGGAALPAGAEAELHPFGGCHHPGAAEPFAEEDEQQREGEADAAAELDEQSFVAEAEDDGDDEHGARHVEVGGRGADPEHPPGDLVAAEEVVVDAFGGGAGEHDADEGDGDEEAEDDRDVDGGEGGGHFGGSCFAP
ncbi:MAG: hypothetical protein R3F65_09890 [bacterium]